MTRIADIEQALAKATPGEWFSRKSKHPIDGAYDFAISADLAPVLAEAFGRAADGACLPAAENAAYIVAVQPANMTILLERMKRMETALEWIARGQPSPTGDSHRATLEAYFDLRNFASATLADVPFVSAAAASAVLGGEP